MSSSMSAEDRELCVMFEGLLGSGLTTVADLKCLGFTEEELARGGVAPAGWPSSTHNAATVTNTPMRGKQQQRLSSVTSPRSPSSLTLTPSPARAAACDGSVSSVRRYKQRSFPSPGEGNSPAALRLSPTGFPSSASSPIPASMQQQQPGLWALQHEGNVEEEVSTGYSSRSGARAMRRYNGGAARKRLWGEEDEVRRLNGEDSVGSGCNGQPKGRTDEADADGGHCGATATTALRCTAPTCLPASSVPQQQQEQQEVESPDGGPSLPLSERERELRLRDAARGERLRVAAAAAAAAAAGDGSGSTSEMALTLPPPFPLAGQRVRRGGANSALRFSGVDAMVVKEIGRHLFRQKSGRDRMSEDCQLDGDSSGGDASEAESRTNRVMLAPDGSTLSLGDMYSGM